MSEKPDSRYLLACMAEEAAELSKACLKALRFGLSDEWEGRSNQAYIQEEMMDVLGVFGMLVEAEILPPANMELIANKILKVMEWWEYSQQRVSWGKEK